MQIHEFKNAHKSLSIINGKVHLDRESIKQFDWNESLAEKDGREVYKITSCWRSD